MTTPMSGSARAARPADRWEINDFDPQDPHAASLVLTAADGTALSMPFDVDLLAAVETVAAAWDGPQQWEHHDDDGDEYDDDGRRDEPRERTSRRDDEDDEDLDDEPEVFGNVARMTGWHQVSALWDGVSTDTRNTLLLVVAALVVLVAIITQFS